MHFEQKNKVKNDSQTCRSRLENTFLILVYNFSPLYWHGNRWTITDSI